MKFKIPFTAVVLIFLVHTPGYTQESAQIHSLAVQAARSGEWDYAFMYYRSLLVSYPESKYTQVALFATGEYYFSLGDNRDAVGAFVKLVNDYPDFNGRPFALMYLWKIAKKEGNDSLVKNLEKEIVSLKRLVLLFKDFKEQGYTSPLYRKYRLLYYIDKLEFYADGELLAKIYY